MSASLIPLAASPQTLTISLAGTTYNLALRYCDVSAALPLGWILDVADQSGNPLVNGIPLVTGVDLLAPFGYLGFPGQLVVYTDGDPTAVPTFENLGTVSNLYFVSPPVQ